MSPRDLASLLSALVLLAASCAEGERGFVDGDTIDLLGRTPDAVVQQPGARRPTLSASWGADREYGWVRWGELHDGEPFVWSRRTEAFLALDCLEPADRRLVLEAWKPPGVQERFEAIVSLNGVEVGRLELTDEPAEHALDVPAKAWRPGRNRLAVAVPRTVELEGGHEVGFALAGVRYDEPRVVDVDRVHRRLVLSGGTSVRYGLEPLAPLRLALHGVTEGRAELEVRLRELDTASGTRGGELLAQTVRLDGDELRRAIDLPGAGEASGGPLELELALRGGAGARFELRELSLVEAHPVERFPVIFVSIDTLSARHLSVYGYERRTTPELERFAEDAVVFEHCVSNTTWTLPSYMSQLSGLYPYAHRLYPNRNAEMWELWSLAENRWTLAELLRGAGYATAGFVDNDWITERFGLAQGFDHFDASAALLPIDDPEGGIKHVSEHARRWLADLEPGDPFFLFLHAFDVHGPYIADDAHHGAFREDLDLEHVAPAGGDVAFGIIPTYVARSLTNEVVPPELPTEPLEAAYDEVVAMVDRELGRFFEHLRERGLYERSLVVVSADHGETMGRAPLLFGHGVLDQDVVHVPLLVKLPGSAHGGTRVTAPVQLVDLYPTMLEMLGRPPRGSLHGSSLAAHWNGATTPDAARPILVEGGAMLQAALFHDGWKLVEKRLGRDSAHPILLSAPHQTRAWAERTRDELRARGTREELFRWLEDPALSRAFFVERPRTGLTEELHARMRKSPEYEGMVRFLRKANDEATYELYDLRVDPRCAKDLAGSKPSKVAELKRLMRTEQARRDEAQRFARPPQAPPALEAAELERLKALGYAGE